MHDAFEPFNPDAALSGHTIRADLAYMPPLPDHQVQTVISYLHEREKDQLAALIKQTKKAALQTLLQALAATLQETTGTEPSRPNQCATFILSAAYMPLLRGALAAYHHHRPSEFIAWYDYASGIAEVAGELCIADAENTGSTRQFKRQSIDVTEEPFLQRPFTSRLSHLYATASIIVKAKDQQAGQLLTQDPTGTTLIAAVVDEIRSEAETSAQSNGIKRILTYQNPQLFLAGAEYAQRLYTALYPLSQ